MGDVFDVGRDGMWMTGRISLTPAAEAYRSFFAFVTDDAKGDQDPPFGEDLLDATHWRSEENRRTFAIEIPAIYDDGTIFWRRRD